jgi:hypothetical protein
MTRLAKKIVRKYTMRYNLFELLAQEIENTFLASGKKVKIVDLGCGSGSYWNIQPLKETLEKYISELYLLDASIKFEKIAHEKTKIIRRRGVLPEVLNSIEENFFDLTIALDLIEHMSTSEGLKLLYEVDRVTMHKSLLFTPNGLVWQPPSKNNIFNAHLSGWTPKEFKKLGWTKVKGLTGWKNHYGAYGLRKHKFNFFTYTFHLATLPMIKNFPNFAFSFLAIKDQKNPRIMIQE